MNPFIACHIVEKMINHTGTDIYLATVFRVFHNINSSYMNFECLTFGRDSAFKLSKPASLLHLCTTFKAKKYQVPESEKQEARAHISSFTHLDITACSQRPRGYSSAGRHL